MSYDFVEQIYFKLPDISEGLQSFRSDHFAESHGLIVEIAAIHEGLTQNFTNYSEDELELSLSTWTTPYSKPIIINHDIFGDPLGRVMGARMAKEEDGIPFIKLQAAVTNVGAMERISDERYLTGSVGGKVEEAICSICGTDFAAEDAKLCKHKRGKVYSGKICSLNMGGIEWKEYSFVNAPADKRSGVVKNADESETWVRSANFFVLDLNNQDVMQLTESEGSIDLLGNMRNKEAMPLYLGLKGSYLSVMAIEESLKENIDNLNTSDTTGNEVANQAQENPMSHKVSEEATTDQDDDILAAVESLEENQDAPAEEAEAEAEADEVSENTENSDSTEEGEQAEESTEDEVEEEVSEEASDSTEDSEDTANEDVEPEVAEDETTSEEAETEDATEATAEEEETVEEETDEVIEASETGEQADETELEEQDSIEPPIEELKSLVESLRDENVRLKKLVRRHLVERVVDRKIEVGIIEPDDRADAIDEHMERTASSLVDTLRDLEGMTLVVSEAKDMPRVEEESEAISENNSEIAGAEEITDQTPEEQAENMLVDVLMGRIKL